MYCILCGKTFKQNDPAICGGQHNGKPMCSFGITKEQGEEMNEEFEPKNASYWKRQCMKLLEERKDNAELLRLLKRYRNETPLGHHPHMIAHQVDEVIKRCECGDAWR